MQQLKMRMKKDWTGFSGGPSYFTDILRVQLILQ